MKSAHDQFRDLYEYRLATLDMMKRNVIQNVSANDALKMATRCWQDFDTILHRYLLKNKGVKKFHDATYPKCQDCKFDEGTQQVKWETKDWMPNRAHPLWYMYKCFNVIQRTIQYYQLVGTTERNPLATSRSSELRPCTTCKGTNGLCIMTNPDAEPIKEYTSCRSED